MFAHMDGWSCHGWSLQVSFFGVFYVSPTKCRILCFVLRAVCRFLAKKSSRGFFYNGGLIFGMLCGGQCLHVWGRLVQNEKTGHSEFFFELVQFMPPFIHFCGGFFFGLDINIQPPLQGMGAGAWLVVVSAAVGAVVQNRQMSKRKKKVFPPLSI